MFESRSGNLLLLKHTCGKATGCYAGINTPVKGCMAAHCGFETQRRRHQKSTTGVSVAPQMDKNFKKTQTYRCIIM